jgi:hypothetical protein
MGWAWYQHALQQTEARDYVGDNPRFLLSPEYVATFDTHRAYFNAVFKKAASDAPFFGDYGNVPHYTTDIAAAWQVVEWMHVWIKQNHPFGDYFDLQLVHWGSEWCAAFDAINTPNEIEEAWYELIDFGPYGERAVRAPTAPLAICKAFLTAMGMEVEDEV